MKRTLLIALALVLAFSLVFATTALAQDEDEEIVRFRVEIRNRTDENVFVTLVGTDVFAGYLLAVAPGSERVFTVREGNYTHTTFACGESAEGTLAVTQQLRFVFTPCFGPAPNQGAPTIEKIHLTDSPEGREWFFKYK